MAGNFLQRVDNFARFVGRNEQDRLSEVKSPVRRRILQGAMATRVLPCIFGKYYYRKDYLPIERFGLDVIGQGYHSIAARDPKTDMVLKFHYRYVGYPETKLRNIIEVFEEKQERCCALGNIAVRQTYEIGDSPYDPTQPIIIARQKFVPVKYNVALAGMPREDIHSIPDIERFTAASREMIDTCAAVADLFGHGNLVVADDKLRLVDPIPLVAEERQKTRYDEAAAVIGSIDKNIA